MNAVHVAAPPEKPLLIWDGDCHFCGRWIERWKGLTRGRVDYLKSQELGDRFPEIPRAQFGQSVVLVDTDGNVSTGAEAVFRSLRSGHSWWFWAYQHLPAFAPLSEFGYALVARNRTAASELTRLIWGNDVREPSYFRARRWFFRGLGLVFLIAFVSLWTQIDGLIGENGILPVGEFLPAAQEQIGGRAYSLLPTLCWFSTSNGFLHFLCGAGTSLSILLIAGVAPAICVALLVAVYLSLTVAGQTFLSFQWDILLIETGFLSILFAPWRLWWSRNSEPPLSRIGFFLLKFLLFKLMLMSGVVKLTSGDDCWWNLTALDYHYWSQPLPTALAWSANLHPEWFKKFSVTLCLFIETVVPFFLWTPRRLRLAAAGLLIFLQIAIAITGNYGFFNLLAAALCLLLIDDQSWSRLKWTRDIERTPAHPFRISWAKTSLGVAVMIVTLPLDLWHIYGGFKPEMEPPAAIVRLEEAVEPFHLASGYGLFRVMTKDRREIEVEGSADGVNWKPYLFRWKPDDPKRGPGWCAPHQPRLDWQMWFAALGSPAQNPWFVRFAVALLEDKKEVSALLATNPFPDNPPKYVRARLYRYRFTTAEEARKSGAWWKREELGEYLPEVSLKQ